MQSHSDLIPRAEALRRLREIVGRRYDYILSRGDYSRCELPHPTQADWARHEIQGVDWAIDTIADIPAIGTCATCAEWLGGEHLWGECVADAYQVEGPGLGTKATHFCAAYKARDAK